MLSADEEHVNGGRSRVQSAESGMTSRQFLIWGSHVGMPAQ